MQQIADLRRQGSATTKERRILLEVHKNKLAEQIERLQEHYKVINEKIEIYRQWELENPQLEVAVEQ
ncbi:hypothetical protein ACFQY3_17895 [Paenibacillus farraposensis]